MYKYLGKIKIFGIVLSVYQKGDIYLYINTDLKYFRKVDLS